MAQTHAEPPPSPALPEPEAPSRPGDLARLSWRKKLGFALAVFAIFFAIAEVAVRIFNPEFAHLRGTATLTCGYLKGPRGARHETFKVLDPMAPNDIRIVMLGDSVIWGHGLSLEDSIPVQTQRKLAAARPDISWTVANLAGIGKRPTLTRESFLDKIDQWHASAVVYQFHINDVALSETEGARDRVVIRKGIAGLFEHKGQALRISYLRISAFLAYLEQKSKDVYRWANGPYEPFANSMAACCDSDEVRIRWNLQFQAMADIKALCDQRGIAFRVYLFPTTEHLSDDPRDNLLNNDRSLFTVDPYVHFLEFCDRYDLRGRHLLKEVRFKRQEMLAGKTPYDRLYLVIDSNHPNPRGAQIFADAIVEDILAEKLVPLPPRPIGQVSGTRE